MPIFTLKQIEEARLEVIEKLKEKYGDKKVQEVDNLGADKVMQVLSSDVNNIPGVQNWMYDIIRDFQNMLLSHPKIGLMN